ncbi:MAG: hypothetical protein A3G60_00635 [Candidatus Ryanbacteria bacterium RIFCSPLOWO2_12_FULL_47_9c]|uniref:DUF4349 domain-containing protein n=2 Tax=Candidatus Ryaniibacteriota TaxID=1817914 RepID=A0A1G2H5N8_9BACT|nr:MAG: hypothetical protein UX74_C0009G0029 [Parcubacteria group bacterium GW2011_GWA2_47_10b]KKU85612.1 MAG: hypothetical protein UY14_C0018G0002 [Parcubacteria group bacterium GW2011_GWA1_47_9]OGZ49098.1 MAG: hypothetical protein A3C83_02030 [Candidatus Ryanbacteria bacterium RIFCSPHIGHO2_02_FULL_47_25]OGZ54890.1 MAG: hypothetical protein A3J04_02320 [Candidatus Ryanbacteria bacterium RIFCSPLOWO2_02_FULL_47_14]OGZ57785.1 MAG: hypothetical protein A3G60_00635 [Candidatus Ryanbacteria bacteriu
MSSHVVKRLVGVVIILIVIVGIASVLLASLNTARNKSSGSVGLSSDGVSPSFYNERDGYDDEDIARQGGVPAGKLAERKVLRNGSLSLLVKKAEEASKAIQDIADRLSGFVQSAQVYEVSSGVQSGSVTIRVPSDYFDEAIGEIKKLAVKVERESATAQDVTEQFVDLEARLKNLRAEETQYLEIMKRASTVQDTLTVSQRLYDVRGRIEQIEGQLKYLTEQIDMSVITVSLTEEADVEVFGIQWRPLYAVKRAFRNMISGLATSVDFIVSIIFFLPVILLWALLIVLAGALLWRLIRWVQRKFFPAAGI